MSKYNALLLPVTTEVTQFSDQTSLTRVGFPDGTKFVEVAFSDDRIQAVGDTDGGILSAEYGRYPFTERVARTAVQHMVETGDLPGSLTGSQA